MEVVGDAEEVGRAHRLRAPVEIVRHGDARRGARHVDIAPLGAQHARLAVGTARQRTESLVELPGCPGAERRQVHVELAHAVHAVVLAAAQLQDLQPLLHQFDERQEAVALQTVPVEIVGRAVRGRDHRQAFAEKGFEQAAEDHRIGNVGDLKLVEAQQLRLRRDRLGDRHDRVGFRWGAPGRQLLAPRVQALMHFEHEFVKVDAALLRHGGVGKKQVHQHRLAAPDRSPDVKPVRFWGRLGGRAEAKPRQKTQLGRLARRRLQPVIDGLQARHDFFLHRIGMDLAPGAACGEIGGRSVAGRGSIGIHVGAYLAHRRAAAYKMRQ